MEFGLDASHVEFQERARQAAEQVVAPYARESDENGVFRRETVVELANLGFLGLAIPTEFGGSEADNLSLAVAYEEFGRVDSSVRGFLTVHLGLVSQCLIGWGTPDQQARWLPRLARGQAFGCYCLTEPGAGSDVASLSTRARRDGDGWAIEGVKHWITNGNLADVALVFATVDPTQRSRGITAFVIPTNTPGFLSEPMQGKELGHRGSDHARITLNDVRVGQDALLGKPGEGFKVAMGALDHGRLGVAAGAVGVLQACLDASVDFARKRRQFGKRIGDFEMIQTVLADMASDVEAARLLVRQAARMRDAGQNNSHAVSMAKLFATEAACRAAEQAVLLHGGRGYSNVYPVERYYRDIMGLQIYEGTSHIQRVIIARHLLGKDDAGTEASDLA